MSRLPKAKWLKSTGLDGALAALVGGDLVAAFPPRLASILDDIDACLRAKLWYPAITVALTLPDICSGLLLDRSKFVKREHYVAFVDEFLDKKKCSISGERCFMLRGGVVHKGTASSHPHLDASHVVFWIPEGDRASMHDFWLEGDGDRALVLDVFKFVEAMKDAVYAWHKKHGTDAIVMSKVNEIMSVRPNGIRKLIGGAPVVASGPD
ncbi:hypothetical protein KZ820_14495 [Sphingomonas sp. RRHST34]|uniref:Uncharacterized protein n=1 Tax=Sphingomonas citri TaxID=2862499 RepID=A0ABS7BQS4_9SPHN|nr:hypothetical protein [Sphingomonas citri]MBW6531948.1 hypothetical protein [Sphingomonas citri]